MKFSLARLDSARIRLVHYGRASSPAQFMQAVITGSPRTSLDLQFRGLVHFFF